MRAFSGFRWSTVLKLGIASLIVGTVLAVVGANPFEFWEGVWNSVRETFEAVFGIGWEGLQKVVSYTLFGAVVVLPIWLVTVLLKRRKPAAGEIHFPVDKRTCGVDRRTAKMMTVGRLRR